MIKALLFVLAISAALLFTPFAAADATPATPLFASDEPIRLTLKGPIAAVAGGAKGARDATLTVHSATPETLAVRISPRGITRLKKDVCQFAPFRVELAQQAPAGSLFQGQRRLKLVTHCRAAAGFQQHLLLEYAAYRLYNQLTPASFRARLAQIDYVDERGRPVISRLGFFIEDIGDVAARNGISSASVGERVPTSQLSARDAARVAVFEYMIGNLDWSTRAGPEGESCCHNSRLIVPAPGTMNALVPVPYDFDFSGLVDAPYAVPPDVVPVRSVRSRYYRGYCLHNAAVQAVMPEFRAQRPQLLALLASIPHMEERTKTKAASYLEGFFADVADDQLVARKLLRTCIN